MISEEFGIGIKKNTKEKVIKNVSSNKKIALKTSIFHLNFGKQKRENI